METITRSTAWRTTPVRHRRARIVLSRPANQPLMVSWARITYDRRQARRAALRRGWRVASAVLVGIAGGLAMYATAAAGVLPLLAGGHEAPPAATASSSP